MPKYTVEALNFPSVSQYAPSQDGQPSENNFDDCGEACVSAVGGYYTATNISPDTLKDWRFGQGTTGVLSTEVDLMSMLAWFYKIPSMARYPKEMHNGTDGLLDLEWQALDKGIPVIELVQWIDRSGRIHPEIGHWVVCVRQNELATVQLDPEPWIVIRRELYAQHWKRFKGICIIPCIAPTP